MLPSNGRVLAQPFLRTSRTVRRVPSLLLCGSIPLSRVWTVLLGRGFRKLLIGRLPRNRHMAGTVCRLNRVVTTRLVL